MTSNSSRNLNNVAGQIPEHSLSLQNMTRDDLIELVHRGVNRYPEFGVLLSEADLTADNRVRLESLEPRTGSEL
jgi:hypothetical protein